MSIGLPRDLPTVNINRCVHWEVLVFVLGSYVLGEPENYNYDMKQWLVTTE